MDLKYGVVLFVTFGTALLVVLGFQRWMVDALIEAIQNFRGGPPAGPHPSPSADSALLLRRRKKLED